MRNQLQLGSLLLLVCVLPYMTAAQTGDEVVLSISAENMMLNLRETTNVRARITNRGRKSITLQGLNVSLHRQRVGSVCVRGDCFGAFFAFKDRKIKSGESFDVEVDLAELHWADQTSSIYDFSQPQNMYSKIARGKYELFIEYGVAAKNSTRTDRFIKSNVISVVRKWP